MHKVLSLAIVLSFIFLPVSLSQDLKDDEIKKQFNLAVNLYKANSFYQAHSIFNKIIDNYEFNSRTTASYFFSSKIYFEQERYDEAERLITKFLELYPSSSYTDEMRMMYVKLNLQQEDYYGALRELAFLVERTDSENYRHRAKGIGGKVAYYYLNSTEIKQLYDSFTGSIVKPFLLLQLGKAISKEGDLLNAKKSLSELINNYPGSEEYTEAADYYSSLSNQTITNSSATLIGVILPLQRNSTGQITSTASLEILEGIKFALSEFNLGREDKIGLVLRDTKNDVEEIKRIKNEFANNSAIKVILGPIFSNEVRPTLNEFIDVNIPIISPTATDDDLTSISDNFFQANPSFSKRGRIMAQYVYFVENKRNISILNAIEGYSPLLAATFATEFEKLGGQILVRETYSSKSFQLDEPVSRIAADSTELEGIYIPLADKIDAPAILSQLVQNELNLTIYGNQDWLIAKGFETSTELSNKITFSSDYFIEFDSDDFQIFNERFANITGKDVNRNVLYGYDTAKYLLTVMRNINNNRINIRNKMISGLTSAGYHNNLAFDETRINRFLNIVRYKDGVFQLVDKFRSSN
jgi:branched-chain amino acid transport system substrate-binding protein